MKTPATPIPLRSQQLEIRHVEILEAFKAFKALVQGNTDLLSNSKDYPAWDSWTNQVNTSTIVFNGHSFGGCTGVSELHLIFLFRPYTLTRHSDPCFNVAHAGRI